MKIAKLKMILAKSELSLVADPRSDYCDTASKKYQRCALQPCGTEHK